MKYKADILEDPVRQRARFEIDESRELLATPRPDPELRWESRAPHVRHTPPLAPSAVLAAMKPAPRQTTPLTKAWVRDVVDNALITIVGEVVRIERTYARLRHLEAERRLAEVEARLATVEARLAERVAS